MLGGCVTMDATEFGAYMSIIVALYQTGGKLPNDDKKLARIARTTIRKWKQIKPEIIVKFDVSDHFWEHKVVTQQLVKYHALSTKNKANALKANDTSQPVAKPDGSQTQANTSNKEQVTSNKEENKQKKKEYSEDFESMWQDFPRGRRGDKENGFKAYKKALTKATREDIHNGIQNYNRSWEAANYPKGFAAWLGDNRWEIDYLGNEAARQSAKNKPSSSNALEAGARKAAKSLFDQGAL